MKNKIFKTISVILCCILVISTILSVTLFVRWQNSDSYVKFDKNKLDEVYGCSAFLDNDGQVLCESAQYDTKKQISLAALPKYVYMAFVATEDKRFFTHNGIDLLRVVSAAFNNITSGSKKEGASTITQQLVKNTHLSGAKTYKRKINEMILAREMEQNYSKQEILEMYLNTIYFGRSAYGVETAANVYFGKSATQLTVGEAAVLAAMIKAPNIYAPDKNTKKCFERRNLVLSLMHKQGIIDDETYTNAKREEIHCKNVVCPTKGYTYFALREAAKLLNMTQRQVMQGGFVIETYCRSQLQKEVTEIVQKDTTSQQDGNLASMCIALCDNKGGIKACCVRGDGLKKGQVGSTLKPIAVYTPAFCEKLVCPASPLLDEKTDFNGYCPTNVGGYKGWTTVANAVLTSSNVGAAKTLNALTINVANKYLNNLGLYGNQDLSLALGNIDGGMDEIDLLHCYTALANSGEAYETKFVKSISNEYGTLYNARDKHTAVYDNSSTFLMTDLLIKNVRMGTARKIDFPQIQVAAKTGTVGNKRGNTDAFTVSYTTQDVLVAHYYGDLPNTVNGCNAPCIATNEILKKLYKQNQPQNFIVPSDVEYVAIDTDILFSEQRIVASDDGEKYPFTDKKMFISQCQ